MSLSNRSSSAGRRTARPLSKHAQDTLVDRLSSLSYSGTRPKSLLHITGTDSTCGEDKSAKMTERPRNIGWEDVFVAGASVDVEFIGSDARVRCGEKTFVVSWVSDIPSPGEAAGMWPSDVARLTSGVVDLQSGARFKHRPVTFAGCQKKNGHVWSASKRKWVPGFETAPQPETEWDFKVLSLPPPSLFALY